MWAVVIEHNPPYHRYAGGALDKHLVQEYRERWRAIEAIDLAEQRGSSVSWRLQQMDAIYRLAVGLKLTGRELSEEHTAVYRRWALLKRRRR
jgi:hypothetical protein